MVAQVIPFAPKNPTDFGRTTAYFLAIDLVYQVKVYKYSTTTPVCWWAEFFRLLEDTRQLKRKGGAEWIKFVHAYNALEQQELGDLLDDDNEPSDFCVWDTDEGDGKPPLTG